MLETIEVAALLAYVNDVLQAIIVIFGTSVVLYNLPRLPRGAVIRAFSALISFVVIVYLAELLVSRVVDPGSAEFLLRMGWIGIAMVPAAQFHLSDALLTTTGKPSKRRRRLVIIGYASGLVFLVLGILTNLIIDGPTASMLTPRLTAGPYFPFFAIYFWVVAASSVYNVWRARGRCLTSTTRQRMTITLLAILAAPLGVFPYTLLGGDVTQEIPVLLWIVLILGNLLVATLFAVLTSQLVYFGAISPDRVVRVRLYKYMARVPLAATILLLVFVIVSRTPQFFGLPKIVALGLSSVATLMLVEWAIHFYKRPLERAFQLNDDPDIRRIQTLSERLLTTSDLQQFLESVLAATCEVLRTPTAFVAAFTSDGPRLESVVGPMAPIENLPPADDLMELARANGRENVESNLETSGDFFIWQGYWIQPLQSENTGQLLGILGVRARAHEPNLTADELALFTRLKHQATSALEDQILQQDVFAAVEGLLPEITALQEKRRAATFGGLPILAADPDPDIDAMLDDPEFNRLVRDALTHFWGGPKLMESPLLSLQVVEQGTVDHEGNPANALRSILADAIEQQRPEGQRNLTTTEWILYNILDLKFVQGRRVREVARRLAMSESDLYRKQRVAIENVARTIATMERATLEKTEEPGAQSPVINEPDSATS